MYNENTKCCLVSNQQIVSASIVKWIGETNCFAQVNGILYHAVYHPITDTLYINDLNGDY